MTQNLERRLNRDLFHYCFLDPKFYEDLKRYIPSETAYRDIVGSLLPEGWELQLDWLWYTATNPCISLPTQGYKIHLSATTASAATLLLRVVPILIDKEASFKFVTDPVMLDYQNSKHYPRGSSGKFVTIYPRNDELCAALLKTLHEATKDMKGPHILSDRPVYGSKTVFYRYGGFFPQYQLTIHGERAPMILGPSGQWIPDLRGPAFELPPGMNDPFQKRSVESIAPPLLHGRFTVEASESFSNAGGVYKGRDTSNGACVLIKEARPCTCTTSDSPGDATDILAKEYRVLLALQPTGCVPLAIDYFDEWDHKFLVEEYVDGMPLSSYRALEETGLLTNRKGTAGRVSNFCERWRRITSNLIDAVEACHENGVVLGDLAPDNIIIDDKSLAIRLIDFEGASILAEIGDSWQVEMVTPGFASPNRLLGKPATFADDWYSLGAVIYSLILPLQSFFSLHPEAQGKFLDEVVEDQGLPREVMDLISALFKADRPLAKELARNRFSEPSRRPAVERLPTPEALQKVVSSITSHILASKDISRSDRLFPGDYRIFSTNPLSISYGAIGQALYLKSTLGEIPDDVRDWVLCHPVTREDYTPGLYIGLAGVAWGLAELGYEDAAYAAMSMAHKSPLLYEAPDVFYGCAGAGLAKLHWWHRTCEPKFRDEACELGDHLLQTAIEDSAGYYWLNLDGGHHFGYAHGGSGIALFLLYLYRASRDARYLKFAIGGLDYEIAQAREKAGYLVWSRAKDNTVYSPYWRYGNAGVGSVLIRFYAILRTEKYLVMAGKAARYAASKFAGFPGQFMGLSGMGEFLLDMYRFTGDTHYRNEAAKIAAGILLYAVPDSQGTAFPGEELMRLSTDYGTGSAGIGMFLHRLLHPAKRLFHDLLLDDCAIGHEGVRSRVEAEKLESQCAKY